jgi:opacity protein-like surface antigen
VRRFEVVNQGIFGNAVHPGGRLTGYALLFRLDGKNYGRVSPFVDVGGGVQHTTLAKRAPELSGSVQFTPQAGVGIQYSFNSRGALMLEYRYMHMSNAGLQSPNHGFNGSMLSLGFRWLRWPHPSH